MTTITTLSLLLLVVLLQLYCAEAGRQGTADKAFIGLKFSVNAVFCDFATEALYANKTDTSFQSKKAGDAIYAEYAVHAEKAKSAKKADEAFSAWHAKGALVAMSAKRLGKNIKGGCRKWKADADRKAKPSAARKKHMGGNIGVKLEKFLGMPPDGENFANLCGKYGNKKPCVYKRKALRAHSAIETRNSTYCLHAAVAKKSANAGYARVAFNAYKANKSETTRFATYSVYSVYATRAEFADFAKYAQCADKLVKTRKAYNKLKAKSPKNPKNVKKV